MLAKNDYHMEHSKKMVNYRPVIYALVFAATYLPVVLLLKHRVLEHSGSILIAIVPIITFSIFIFQYIKAFSEMDEVKQRVQFEAVIIGFSLTALLLMILFLLSLCDISMPDFFGYSHLMGYCWLFYLLDGLFRKGNMAHEEYDKG